ncbi:MAG: glycosyltransferase [Verrucomicrobiae bacterium]|nr:glycosyltransferase [Verrucomicrobiae bacterium]
MTRGFDIWLHAYFLAGLIELADRHVLRLQLRVPSNDDALPDWCRDGYPLFVVQCHRNWLVFDPADHSDRWQSEALRDCSAYFKRSFHPPDLSGLPADHRKKIHPLNPIFATWYRSPRWSARLVFALLRQPIPWPLRRKALLTFTQLSRLEAYEATPTENKQPKVLFQTRLWNPAEETGDWVEPTNAHRVALVRALRRTLGDRLVGGLIREPYAERHYPDLITNLTASGRARRPLFIRLCRQFLVRINIRALFDAIPYSLAETLAANNCLVSEPVRNMCATPLIAGQHYLSFRSPEECAEHCRELLDSPRQAQVLREQAYEYYRTAVQPAAAMRLYLTQAGIL